MEKKVGIYLRVSTKGQSTELQRSEIETYLKARGHSLWQTYEDKASGATTVRPELSCILRDARQGKIKIIVIWKLDRLFRSLKDLVTTLREFQEIGVELISIKDQLDMTTSSGRLMLHLIGAFAEFERDLIVSRVNAGLEQAKRNGVRLGRPSTVPASEVLKLRSQGLSLETIAHRIGASKSAVHKTLKRLALQPTEFVDLKSNDLPVYKTIVLETPTKVKG